MDDFTDASSSAASPSTPTIAFFQSKPSLEDFAAFDFSDSLFTSDPDLTSASAASTPSLPFNEREAQKQHDDCFSMDVASMPIEPVAWTPSSSAQKRAITTQSRESKKPRLHPPQYSSSTALAPAEVKLQVRKVKQRSYERTYRGRLRTKRAEDEALWMQLEAQLRSMLAEKRAVHAQETPLPPATDMDMGSSPSSSILALECIELAHQVHALQEEKAFWVAVERWIGALNMWGAETESSRSIRYQINALPKLSSCPTFTHFTW